MRHLGALLSPRDLLTKYQRRSKTLSIPRYFPFTFFRSGAWLFQAYSNIPLHDHHSVNVRCPTFYHAAIKLAINSSSRSKIPRRLPTTNNKQLAGEGKDDSEVLNLPFEALSLRRQTILRSVRAGDWLKYYIVVPAFGLLSFSYDIRVPFTLSQCTRSSFLLSPTLLTLSLLPCLQPSHFSVHLYFK